MPDMTAATLADSQSLIKILWFVTVLALLVERALSLVFEHRLWVAMERTFVSSGLKEVVVALLCWVICSGAGFDAFGIMFSRPPSPFGVVLTAFVIAGGSKGMLRLMRDGLGVGKPAIVNSAVRTGRR